MRKKSLAHRYCARVYLSIDVNKILELFTGSLESGPKSDHSIMGFLAISKNFETQDKRRHADFFRKSRLLLRYNAKNKC